MEIDSALLSSGAALIGALIGGGASLAVAIYTQRNQDRLQRIAQEITKREGLYAEFMMKASNLLIEAYVHDTDAAELTEGGERLIGIINRMRLFAPPDVVEEAEATLRAIIEISLRPRVGLGELAREALSKRPDPDRLLRFGELCRADLENVRRTTA
ncbi:hypothetical protein GXW74_19440 [Roseomonas eburnea]|uniref:Uncharacterized protein n=1 Tax=Neoroseomonas eburnea TaxID=1346889 RepID=A0A9X9XG39_9PROT|nr:hypothetical protein [Neoroseomonas eburnea]MBR0682675.1 hypothetical protein [Neoroseomonas eburnea]